MTTSISTLRVLLLGMSSLSLCARTTASDQSPAPRIATSPPLPGSDTTYDFECDVPPGHFSYWSRSVSGESFVISGTLQMKELRSDQRSTAAARIAAVLGGNKDIVLRIARLSASDRTLTVDIGDERAPEASHRVIGSLADRAGIGALFL